MNDRQLANVLAALAVHLSEGIVKRTDAAAKHGSAAPSALVSILNHPAKTIDYLRQVLGMTHSGTVRLVDRLVEAGLVSRGRGPDGRSLALTCTRRGSKVALRILTARESVTLPLLAPMNAEEKSQLENILKKLPWTGITSSTDALHVCRLCEEASCERGGCPVTEARKRSAP